MILCIFKFHQFDQLYELSSIIPFSTTITVTLCEPPDIHLSAVSKM